MKRKLIALGVLLLVAAITGVSFAQTATTTGVTISEGGVDGHLEEIKTNAQAIADGIQLRYSGGTTTSPTATAPTWTPIVSAAGNITAGDIFYVNSVGGIGDLHAQLYLTNPEELKKNYSYILLQINVWSGGEGNWSQASRANGDSIGTVYLTLSNGYVNFILDSNTEYAITVDGGSFFCIDTDASGGSLSPMFFLDGGQA